MRAALAVTLAAALAGLGATAGAATAPAGRGATVTIQDNVFERGGVLRPTVRVRRGSVVVWHWHSQESHNVTVRSGPQRFHSRTQARPGVFSRRVDRAGTYRIVCTLHSPGMRMTLVVVR